MTSLPFLYPRMARQMRGTVVRQFVRAYSDADAPSSASPPTPPTPTPTTTAKNPLFRVRKDPIPFELPPDMEAEVEPEERIEGTITPIERQAFTKIFRDISRKIPSESDVANTKRDAVDILLDASSEQFRAREQFRSERREAFEAARTAASVSVLSQLSDVGVDGTAPSVDGPPSTTQSKADTDAEAAEAAAAAHRRRALAQFPPSLRSAASDAIGSRERKMLTARQQRQQQMQDEQDPVMLAAAKKAADTEDLRQKRLEKMEHVMLSMRTDAALWEYMEECVFSMVDEFNLLDTKPSSSSSPSSPSALPRQAKDRAQRDKGRKVDAARLPESKRPSARLLTYGPVYPAALLHGLKLLGGHYGGGKTSPLALAVLPRIKSLGLQSYVLGANTPLYNELLRIQWTRLGDAAAVFALLREMQQAGLAFNDSTLAVLKSMEFHMGTIRPDAAPQMAVDLDSVHRPLGTGQGTSFVGAAMKHLPDVATVPIMVGRWRKQVQAGAINNWRFS